MTAPCFWFYKNTETNVAPLQSGQIRNRFGMRSKYDSKHNIIPIHTKLLCCFTAVRVNMLLYYVWCNDEYGKNYRPRFISMKFSKTFGSSLLPRAASNKVTNIVYLF